MSAFSGVQTDDRGVYRMFGVPAGRYTVSTGIGRETFYMTAISGRAAYKQVFHPDVTDAAKATVIEVSEGSETGNVDIALGHSLPTFAASGHVLDESGRPVTNIRLGLQMTFGDQNSFSGVGSTPNSQGEFRMENLVPGKYAIFAFPQTENSLHTETLAFEIVDQDVEGLVIKASKGASLSGVVVLENSTDRAVLARLSQLRIVGFVRSSANAANFGLSSQVNADGSFSLSGLSAGKAFLSLGGGPDQTLTKGLRLRVRSLTAFHSHRALTLMMAIKSRESVWSSVMAMPLYTAQSIW
jgi:hypothetical protein